MKKAIIFDLDGTLLNTLPTIGYYVNASMKAFGLGWIDQKHICRYVGNGAEQLIRRSLAHLGKNDEETLRQVLPHYTKAYDLAPLYLTEVYDGISDLIAELKSRGVACAVLSNKPDFAANEVVKYFFGDDFAVVQGAKPDVPLKPAPDAVFEVLSKMGIDKNDAFFVGDTIVDMETGKNASMKTIGVLWGFRDREELERGQATYIVASPHEILGLLSE